MQINIMLSLCKYCVSTSVLKRLLVVKKQNTDKLMQKINKYKNTAIKKNIVNEKWSKYRYSIGLILRYIMLLLDTGSSFMHIYYVYFDLRLKCNAICEIPPKRKHTLHILTQTSQMSVTITVCKYYVYKCYE